MYERLFEKPTCTADLTPNPFVRRGEYGNGKDPPPKVEARENSISTNAGAPSPYEGEGWVGVSQDE
jgi:hypothetical protein